ncbi:hypothetical protein CJ179_31900 [Rhodococcus sp. ACS1]|uniref:hypothetical protein n=1 Tax=Rhodococcus sp. ACS1 TaxID=2028570 RepID=UPI000BB12C67|nr:hypothetical protein [Rhodococcus sp. ACS1]PBC39782.1 hypothetical protein CJ179_31900 [Rhodococcus sp. ACS1]
MPVWGWILIAVLVVIAVLAIFASRSISSRKRTERLKGRFGPEYERTVGEAGDQGAAEKELAARERKREKLDIVPLPPEARAKYTDSWRTVQIEFVDNPSSAVAAADRLVIHVMRERGYPIDDFDQRAADISVDHPKVVENYRTAHGIYLAQEQGDIGTEQQREAFVHYRELFEKLLETDESKDEPNKDESKETRA